MSAFQRELRISRVIEANRLPLLRRMAFIAFGSESTGMNILSLVAIDAPIGQTFVAFSNMTGRAGHLAVGAIERKGCLCVVKGLGLSPIVFTMA